MIDGLEVALYDTCDGKTKAETLCQRPAGWGTDHPGQGRCKLHAGVSGTITHGRYSKIKRPALKAVMAQYEADPEPLNLLPELAFLRSVLHDYVDGKGMPPDPDTTARLLAEISRIVARIEKVKSDNHITRADLCRVMQEMGRTVDRYVPDNDIKEKIRDDWLSIRL